jgi:hypothetical protein
MGNKTPLYKNSEYSRSKFPNEKTVNRIAGWIKMLNQIICCLQQMNPLTKTNICLVWKDEKGVSNQACKSILRPDKTDFKTGLVKREKEVHITLMMVKGHKGEITIANTASIACWILLNKYYKEF